MFFFTASETLFMVSMAMSYFYSYQTYAIDDFTPGGELKNSEVIVGVDISEVIGHLASLTVI